MYVCGGGRESTVLVMLGMCFMDYILEDKNSVILPLFQISLKLFTKRELSIHARSWIRMRTIFSLLK